MSAPQGISVVIPVFNGALYIAECIASVLAQTLPAREIIAVDDGSEDATPAVVASFGEQVRHLRLPHGGLPYARNRGISASAGDYIAFIDSDDLWLPDKLALQVAAVERTALPLMVFGAVEQFVSPDLSPEEAGALRVDVEPLSAPFPSTLLMRRADFDRAGRFDETIETGEFIEWHSRATDARIGSLVLPEVVCRRRIHRSNMGRKPGATHARYVHMLKKVLDRRRGGG